MFARAMTTIVPRIKVAAELLAVLLMLAVVTVIMTVVMIAVVTDDVVAQSQADSPGRTARSGENPQ